MIHPAARPHPRRRPLTRTLAPTLLTLASALALGACGDVSEPDTAMNAGDIPENQGNRQNANGNVGVGGPVVRQSPEPTGNPAGAQGYPATGRP